MSKIFTGLVVLGLAVLAGRWACHALASDETRIRWRIEAMQEGFNDQRTARVLRGLTQDFRDATEGVGRQEVREALASIFLRNLGNQGVPTEYRLELPDEHWRIELHEEPEADADGPQRARAWIKAVFTEVRGEATELYWDVDIEAELIEDPEQGWLIQRTEHKTISGRRRF
jgi:hypothetical protein